MTSPSNLNLIFAVSDFDEDAGTQLAIASGFTGVGGETTDWNPPIRKSDLDYTKIRHCFNEIAEKYIANIEFSDEVQLIAGTT